MFESRHHRRLAWTLAFGFIVVSLAVLGIRTLVPPDEGRYAEMAREMLVSGDWITPRLDGIKYFEKPPLQTWMNALTFAAFGFGDWQARLWTGLCGLFGVGLTGLAGWRVFGARSGLYAALVLGSSFYWAGWSQVLTLDMGLSAMMALALCGLLLAQRDGAPDAERRAGMLACWAGMALAVLSKGLIGIALPGAVLVAYSLAARDRAIWKTLHIRQGLPLLLLIAAPWFVLVALKNPEQPRFFFVHEHFERFLLKEHHREAPWWFFLALIALGSLPWLGALPQALLAARRRTAGRFQPRLLLLAWILVILAFFSASSSKLAGYILPVFPALALLIGDYLATVRRGALALNAALAAGTGLVLLGMAPWLASRASAAAPYQACEPWLLAAGAAALAGGLLALHHGWRLRQDLAVAALALAGFLATQLVMAGSEPIGRLRAGAELLPAMQAALGPNTHVYSVGIYEQSLTFYLRQPVTLVDYRDEFDFGLRQEPGLTLSSIDAFARRWHAHTAAGQPALAIVRKDLVDILRRQGLPCRIVAADGRRTVIANPTPTLVQQ